MCPMYFDSAKQALPDLQQRLTDGAESRLFIALILLASSLNINKMQRYILNLNNR